jgi:general L-amino acid transport system substrate-binding protein
LLFLFLALAWLPRLAAATTLADVRAHGTLHCGVVGAPEDWNKTDLHGPLVPLYTEICKAVSVAALGDKAKVDLKPYLTEKEAAQGVAEGDVDLTVGVSPDATSMSQFNVAFGPPVFYDGQGFLVRGDLHATSIDSLAGKRICAIEGTDNERVLSASAKARGIALTTRDWQEESEMDDALSVRRCDGVSAYLSRLAHLRNSYPALARDTLLAETLTLVPAVTAYRADDRQWAMIVDWTIYALEQAEASGITRANVSKQASNEDPVVQRLLGVDWSASRALGLAAHDWAAQVIAVVGNYGEIYDRTVGANGDLRLPRGLNALWLNGGLIHPLPVR